MSGSLAPRGLRGLTHERFGGRVRWRVRGRGRGGGGGGVKGSKGINIR